MDNINIIKNLEVPNKTIDVVIDTDAYNEVDDQFAIAYLLKSKEKLNTKAIYAAPFHNKWNINHPSTGPKDGMEQSYNEILKLLDLMDEKMDVYKGSESFLTDEKTPVISDAANDLAKRCEQYSPENPLYVVAIGAITNVASAILLNPKMIENTVIVWLGGHALHFEHTKEFNMIQDVAAARIVMGCGVPFVQLPCEGVVSAFTISKPELEYWFKGKNKLCDYLCENAIETAEAYAKGKPWTRCIWDVTAVGWLLNDNRRFMSSRLIPSPIPSYDGKYTHNPSGHLINYIYRIKRDELMEDMINKLTK